MIDICNYCLSAAAADEDVQFIRLSSLLFLLKV